MIKIVTDSTAYLTDEEIKKFGIEVIPLHIQFNNKSFAETEYPTSEFFKQLRSDPKLFPTTSQPPVGKFVELYKRIAKPEDEIISIHISGDISGTIKSAQSAALLLPNHKIHIVDSLTTVAGQGIIVKEAAMLAQSGKNKEDILKAIDYIKNNLTTLFMVNNLEYLWRGGRIGGAAALIGTLLQIKPILTIKGKIDVYQKVRTKQKALAVMVKALEEAVDAFSIANLKVAVMNVDAKEEAQELIGLIKEKHPDLNLEHYSIGPVIGSHVGPGTIGVAFGPVSRS